MRKLEPRAPPSAILIAMATSICLWPITSRSIRPNAPFRRDPVTGKADYGLPQEFGGLPDVLYRNEGNGRFRDVTKSAGVAGTGRGMGVLATDLDGDGRLDWLVANDAAKQRSLAEPRRRHV